MNCLLSTREMYAADAAAMAAGISGEALMEAAGWQVAMAVRRRFRPRPVRVLCGPGNNGGDGFVVARLLDAWGWPVRVALLGEAGRLKGDAAAMAKRWTRPVEPLTPEFLAGRPLVIDALFGAGLARPLDGVARAVVEDMAGRALEVVAIDVPSGVDGDTGQILGTAAPAVLTVTFFRAKPGHVLLPGRRLCGDLVVADIGTPQSVLASLGPSAFINEPAAWTAFIPWPQLEGHKYDRGHLLVAGGAVMTGAGRLVALAARRAGAGLVTIAAPPDVAAIYRTDRPGTIVQSLADWDVLVADRRKNAVVAGPGLGVGELPRNLVLSALSAGKSCVLDADGLTSFAGCAEPLWGLAGQLVLTPHDGEYARLFGYEGDRLSRARQAAAESGAVVLLKGPDTVVAAPDGRATVTVDAPPTLATGGTGDVLAGIIGGLLAQGVPPFEAASMGAWMHGRAAVRIGLGLIAEDLIDAMPAVWRDLAARADGKGPSLTEQRQGSA